MAWSFQAIDATLSPRPRRFDGVEVHKGPRNISQDNLTHWLIYTQVNRVPGNFHIEARSAHHEINAALANVRRRGRMLSRRFPSASERSLGAEISRVWLRE